MEEDDANDFYEEADDVEVVYLDDDIEEESAEEMVEDENISEKIEVEDLSKFTFTKHTKPVFCSDVSKDGIFAATGGEDDNAYLWSIMDGEIILECTGHKDSVTVVCFNHDGQLLATGDMAGMIQVWSIKEKKLIWCFEGDDMEWLTWHPFTNVLIAGSHSGEVYVWQVPQGNCKVLISQGSPCTCGRILPDGKKLLVGYEDGQVKLWDIKAANVLWSTGDSQTGAIISVEVNHDGTLASVAPSSCLLKISDGKHIASLLGEGESEIETHVFNNEFNVLITGSLSGQICVWDLSRHTVRHQAKIESGITTLKLGLHGQLFIGATDGAVYVCDVRSGTLLKTLTGHKADILSLSVFADGCSILTTSDDKTAKIFNTKS